MGAHSIASINKLSDPQKREIYLRLFPSQVFDQFHLNPFLVDKDGNDLLAIDAPPGSTDVEIYLFHKYGFPDPIIYGHMTDTMNGQIHLLLYIMNNPASPRFDVDKMPDGNPTVFGTNQRNIEAETAAMQNNLNPGQIRSGLNLLTKATESFELFIKSIGHIIYFVEPLYYHNAIIFERYGFKYQSGRRRMEAIHTRFSPGGDLIPQLDGSTFRQPQAEHSIRLRSWAIHDGILGAPFNNVTMYKTIDKPANLNTAPGTAW